MAIMIEVKDKEKVQQFVDRLLEMAQTEGSVRVMTRAYNGVDIDTVIAIPVVSPAVAVLDDFLVISTSAETMKGIIDAGTDGKTIEQRADFVATMAGLPKTGTEICYLDLKEVYEFVLPIVASRVPADGPGGDIVKDLGAIGQHLGGIAAVGSGDASGVTYTMYSTKALLEPLVLGGAAVILPAMSSARDRAQQVASMSNVRQLCMAIMMYENENEKLPEKLSDLAGYIENSSVFVHPKNRAKAALIDLDKPETIDANSDYELVIKGGSSADIDDPTETVIIREKEGLTGRGRVLGFVDGHVEVQRGGHVPMRVEDDGMVPVDEWPEDE